MARLPDGPDNTPTNIYNPTKKDFSCTYAEEKIPITFTLPSRQMKTFPKYLADHIAKHLARQIALENDSGLMFELRLKEAMDKITVTL
jgi:hypothetical protein